MEAAPREGRGHGLHELLCSLLRCLLRPIVVRGLMGWDPRGRVLGLVPESVWFVIGEENGVVDKAGEMRAQARDPQQGPPPYCTVGAGKPPNFGETEGCLPPCPLTTCCVASGKYLPLWVSRTAGISRTC